MGFDPRKFINSLPGIGGLTSSLWGDPSQEGVQQAYAQALEELKKNRSNMMDSRMNAMNQGALAFGPRNQMLGEMMGKGPGQNAMDLAPMLQNPMPMNMQNDIRQQAFGSTPPMNAPPMAGGQPTPPGGAFTGVGPQNPFRRQ
jgi:hypothetical protein